MARKIVCWGGSLDGKQYVVATDIVSMTVPRQQGDEVYSPAKPPKVIDGHEVWVPRENNALPSSMTPEQRERFEAQR